MKANTMDRVCWWVLAHQHTRPMANTPFRPCDFCGTAKAPRPWTLIETTRKMACPTCTPAALAEARKARRILKRYRHLIGNRIVAEPALAAHHQYVRIKSQYPDALLIFRLGDEYIAMDEDARHLNRHLGMTITRYQPYGLDRVSFPVHALDQYLPRIVRKGFRVALCDQLQEHAHDTDVATMPQQYGFEEEDNVLCEPMDRRTKNELRQVTHRLEDLMHVLRRHGALPNTKGMEPWKAQEVEVAARNAMYRGRDLLVAELRLRRAWISKHQSLHFGMCGTKVNCNPWHLPFLLADYRRNASGKPFYFRSTLGKAPEHAIGNFSTEEDCQRALRYAEHNLAEAQERAIAVPALITHWQKHLQQVRHRMGLPAVQAEGHSVQPHAQAA